MGQGDKNVLECLRSHDQDEYPYPYVVKKHIKTLLFQTQMTDGMTFHFERKIKFAPLCIYKVKSLDSRLALA